ncbi:MAG: DUF116 domain-containing protein [Methanosarcinales archaeon Met12]|nr:MAG: DUF116 domain-containing protein [Methanosarcinales archaeon Met12]
MLEQLYPIIGQIVVYLFFIILIATIVIAMLALYYFKTGDSPTPNVLLSGLLVLEGFVKAFFRLAGLDDSIIDKVAIQLQNKISSRQFNAHPPTEKAIFFPQCLRSIDCIAKLSPEGIQCVHCDRCEIGAAKKILEEQGYTVFIVPGSSFIKRMIMKYAPKAIVGIGCATEIKGGMELCHRFNVPPSA